MSHQNPFVFDQASTLDDEEVLDYYIDDYNYARLIQSKRNVFLVGERGSGKTMTLRYNTLTIQRRKAARDRQDLNLEWIGVLVPCNTPLTHKEEHRLLPPLQANLLSEHLFVLSIAYELAGELAELPGLLAGVDEDDFRQRLEFVIGLEIPKKCGVFVGLQMAVDREAGRAQRRLNDAEGGGVPDGIASFSGLIVPLLHSLRRLRRLARSHFLLMVDDAHSLNEHQIKALNSWIGYRERSIFSFKVASAKVGKPARITAAGGSILEGHDFIEVDLEQRYHNDESDYAHLAERVVERRLVKFAIQRSPDAFFPPHPKFEEDLKTAEAEVRQQAVEKYGTAAKKSIRDFVYKFRRAHYFRQRDPKANRPIYAGFQTLVYLSTGLIRNLLEPCWFMYDEVWSALPEEGRLPEAIREIPPDVQSRHIHNRSEAAWNRLRELHTSIEGCSSEEQVKVYQLFDSLATFFRERLLKHQSEPGAISFSVSARDQDAMARLDPLLDIARKAQLLYVREGPAKTEGRRELYYVPNRMLWPNRGLDPFGQHARASIPAIALARAADGKRIPLDDGDDHAQLELGTLRD